MGLFHRSKAGSLCIFCMLIGLMNYPLSKDFMNLSEVLLFKRSHQFAVDLTRCNSKLYAKKPSSRTSHLWNFLLSCFSANFDKCKYNVCLHSLILFSRSIMSFFFSNSFTFNNIYVVVHLMSYSKMMKIFSDIYNFLNIARVFFLYSCQRIKL